MNYNYKYIIAYGEKWNNLDKLLEDINYLDKLKIHYPRAVNNFPLRVYHKIDHYQLWTHDECIELLKKRINELHQQNLFTVICDMNQINEPPPAYSICLK